MKNKFNLTNKTVLITGGGGLLGIEHATALLEIGAKVIITDINSDLLLRAKDILSNKFNLKNILIFKMDVTKLDSIKEISNEIIKLGLRVDILINNAAIDPKVKGNNVNVETSRLEEFSLNQWNIEVSVGLTGAFLCSQVFGKLMSLDGLGGNILNIASDLSIISPFQDLYKKENLPENLQPVKPITYSVIKSGLVGMTKYLATYWAEKGVRSNALSPGGVYVDQNEQFVKKISSLIPLNRMANKDEYHGAIQFLCSDASAYLNGQNIVMDGGRSVW